MNYDIVGDIHGQADKLEALLLRMGYAHRAGAWRKAGHTAVFVGDLIDRGPGQLRTLKIVRDMIDAGSGLTSMGNHEYNAIGWATLEPPVTGKPLRTHSHEKRKDHQAFLSEVQPDSGLHRTWIDWFRTLPMWLELPGLRVIHACWDEANINLLRKVCGPGNLLTERLLIDSHSKGSAEHKAIESILKGLEVDLPDGKTFLDKSGSTRSSVRVRWWHTGSTALVDLALGINEDELREVAHLQVKPQTIPGYDHPAPVFCGHYWMTGTPYPQTPKVACVDYSAGKDGPLVAYQWQGESVLDASSFAAAHR
jgi:hypothetical protein